MRRAGKQYRDMKRVAVGQLSCSNGLQIDSFELKSYFDVDKSVKVHVGELLYQWRGVKHLMC